MTDEGKMITLVMGDIIEYPVDVIVNAANTMLNHVDGVAAAIARKGGKVIQEESTCYIQNEGKLCDGDAIMMKEVGNLPCQCLIHAVFPRWDGGTNNEESKLIIACIKSLNLANHYQSVAFPRCRYGFPAAVYAHSMIKAFVSWSKSNAVSTLCDIHVIVSDTALASAFTEEMRKNKHCRVLSGHLGVNVVVSTRLSGSQNRWDKKQTDNTTIELDKYTVSSVREPSLPSGPQLQLEYQDLPPSDLPSGDIQFAEQYIELYYGNLVDYQVTLYSSYIYSS